MRALACALAVLGPLAVRTSVADDAPIEFRATPVPPPPGANGVRGLGIVDINNGGDAVGVHSVRWYEGASRVGCRYVAQAFVYRRGLSRALPRFGYCAVFPVGIADTGRVLLDLNSDYKPDDEREDRYDSAVIDADGTRLDPDSFTFLQDVSRPNRLGHFVMWSQRYLSVVRESTSESVPPPYEPFWPTYEYRKAMIGDAGHIVVVVRPQNESPENPRRVLSFLDGSWTDRGTAEGACCVNSRGEILASGYSGEYVLIRDTDSVELDLPEWSVLADMNDRGDMVGYQETSGSERHAFLLRAGKRTDLARAVVGGLEGVRWSEAGAVSERGQIALNTNRGAFILSPVPHRLRLREAVGGAAWSPHRSRVNEETRAENSGPARGPVPMNRRNELMDIRTLSSDPPSDLSIRGATERLLRVPTTAGVVKVVFKCEESRSRKTQERPTHWANDFFMHEAVVPPLLELARLVALEFPASEGGEILVRVTESYDDPEFEHEHRGPLHYEGRALDVTLVDVARGRLKPRHYGRLGALAACAGFDWVYYENAEHVHASVR